MADRGSVAAIVLAAGSSRRLGRPKQLLQINGTALVRHVVDRVTAAGIDQIVVVVGHGADAVAATLATAPVRIVRNDAFATGQASSLRAGLQALGDHVRRVVVVLADQPHIPVAAIVGVADGPGPIRRARYQGTTGHPVAFDRAVFGDLMTITGDRGARDVIAAHAEQVRFVDLDMPAPRDVDTDDDALALGAR